ncbi:hypothetical protein ACV3S7_00795 [Clostridium perfringens]|uniref:hypothetical protein n=1 Tax=Clostridium perfringens TaxID=1502 RepID=UPI000BBAFA03|nr:hypothetical protein [Clostridium perfringens]MBI6071170.1 hypothetical protein [Clostridium perfringens]
MDLKQSLKGRTRELITLAWSIFSNKVGNGIITINKEASMQLRYAYILQQLIPFIILKENEKVDLELETTINDGESNRELDILIKGSDGIDNFNIAIELKCYKKKASSGKLRGATDIFMKNVYNDLYQLEMYCKNSKIDIGIELVMNDLSNFVRPKNKDKKCWDYDISNGYKLYGPQTFNTPIGGKSVNITLNKNYEFKWEKIGEFWFMELEGK